VTRRNLNIDITGITEMLTLAIAPAVRPLPSYCRASDTEALVCVHLLSMTQKKAAKILDVSPACVRQRLMRMRSRRRRLLRHKMLLQRMGRWRAATST
jgi:DNA-directed RNA polymerase specialized sigma24 family protein